MFDESKHPRDEDGKFTDVRGITFRQNTSYNDILAESRNQKSNSTKPYLSKQEWAMFYERIGKIKKRGSLCSENGER